MEPHEHGSNFVVHHFKFCRHDNTCRFYLSQMVGLYRDPHGKKIFFKNKSTTTTSTEKANKIAENLKKRVSELEKKLTEVRRLQHIS